MQVLVQQNHRFDFGRRESGDRTSAIRKRITRNLIRAITASKAASHYIMPRAQFLEFLKGVDLYPQLEGGDPDSPFRMFKTNRNRLRKFYREVNESMRCSMVSGSDIRLRRGYDRYGQEYIRGTATLNAFVKMSTWDYIKLPNGQVYVAKIKYNGPGLSAQCVFIEIIGFESAMGITWTEDVSNTEIGIFEPRDEPLSPRLLELGLREQARRDEAQREWIRLHGPVAPQLPAQRITEIYDPPSKGLSSHLSAYQGHVLQIAKNRTAHIRAFDQARKHLIEVKILPDFFYEHAFVSRHVSDLDSKYGGSNVFYSAKDNMALCVRGFIVYKWYTGPSGRVYSTVTFDSTEHIKKCGGTWSRVRSFFTRSRTTTESTSTAIVSSLKRTRDDDDLEEDELEQRDRKEPALTTALVVPPVEIVGYKITYMTTTDNAIPCIVKVKIPVDSPVIAPLDAEDYVGKLRTTRVTVVGMWMVKYNRDDTRYTMVQVAPSTPSASSFPTSGVTKWTQDSSVVAGACDPDVSKACSNGIHFWPTLARALQFAGINIIDVSYPPEVDGRLEK
jgi:hypothetical protein